MCLMRHDLISALRMPLCHAKAFIGVVAYGVGRFAFLNALEIKRPRFSAERNP